MAKLGYFLWNLVEEWTVATDRHSKVHSLCALQRKLALRCCSVPAKSSVHTKKNVLKLVYSECQ